MKRLPKALTNTNTKISFLMGIALYASLAACIGLFHLIDLIPDTNIYVRIIEIVVLVTFIIIFILLVLAGPGFIKYKNPDISIWPLTIFPPVIFLTIYYIDIDNQSSIGDVVGLIIINTILIYVSCYIGMKILKKERLPKILINKEPLPKILINTAISFSMGIALYASLAACVVLSNLIERLPDTNIYAKIIDIVVDACFSILVLAGPGFIKYKNPDIPIWPLMIFFPVILVTLYQIDIDNQSSTGGVTVVGLILINSALIYVSCLIGMKILKWRNSRISGQ